MDYKYEPIYIISTMENKKADTAVKSKYFGVEYRYFGVKKQGSDKNWPELGRPNLPTYIITQ